MGKAKWSSKRPPIRPYRAPEPAAQALAAPPPLTSTLRKLAAPHRRLLQVLLMTTRGRRDFHGSSCRCSNTLAAPADRRDQPTRAPARLCPACGRSPRTGRTEPAPPQGVCGAAAAKAAAGNVLATQGFHERCCRCLNTHTATTDRRRRARARLCPARDRSSRGPAPTRPRSASRATAPSMGGRAKGRAPPATPRHPTRHAAHCRQHGRRLPLASPPAPMATRTGPSHSAGGDGTADRC